VSEETDEQFLHIWWGSESDAPYKSVSIYIDNDGDADNVQVNCTKSVGGKTTWETKSVTIFPLSRGIVAYLSDVNNCVNNRINNHVTNCIKSCHQLYQIMSPIVSTIMSPIVSTIMSPIVLTRTVTMKNSVLGIPGFAFLSLFALYTVAS
jgi:hypothetical protein